MDELPQDLTELPHDLTLSRQFHEDLLRSILQPSELTPEKRDLFQWVLGVPLVNPLRADRRGRICPARGQKHLNTILHELFLYHWVLGIPLG